MKASTLLSIARARVFSTPKPIAVGFELTHLCNLACSYCDRHTPLPKEMSLSEIFAAFSGLERLGMREISLDGGEALAHRRIDEIVGFLRKRAIVVRLNTNGILLPKKKHLIPSFEKIKISLDGPAEVHDRARGPHAFERAVAGARLARDLGARVELTCVIGRHNADSVDALLEIARSLELGVIFQPARDSLFQGESGPGAAYRLDGQQVRAAFARVEAHKRAGNSVLNGWSSLRHFRSFPNDTPLPCAAGWINLTLDPEGNLYHCGQVNRRDKSRNLVELGVEEAFNRLTRHGCQQCWCARVVEENYAWGGQFAKSLPLPPAETQPEPERRRLAISR
ncbi:MAG TPA: radical SAM protein [Polyangiaceae bacterium]|jgi:MoaA/NifB/PqqE/SkfB family radical SAM enzyme